MFPIYWKVENKTTPKNVLKARMSLDVSTIAVQNGHNSESVTLGQSVSHVVDAFDSRIPDQSDSPSAASSSRTPTAFTAETVRKDGIDKFKFDYNFIVKSPPPEDVPRRFRGYFVIRSPEFGPWEPVSHTSFLQGSLNSVATLDIADGATTPTYTCSLTQPIKVKVNLNAHRLKNHPNSNGNSERTLEALLFVEFLPSHTLSPTKNPDKVINNRQIAEDTVKMNSHTSRKTDAELQFNNEVFWCHSKKIIEVSSFLRPRLVRDGDGDDARIIRDMSPYFSSSDGVTAFLRFVYFFELPQPAETVNSDWLRILFELLKFAHNYDVSQLRDAVLEDINRNVALVDFTFGLDIHTFTLTDDVFQTLRKSLVSHLYAQAVLLDENQMAEYNESHPKAMEEIQEFQPLLQDRVSLENRINNVNIRPI